MPRNYGLLKVRKPKNKGFLTTLTYFYQISYIIVKNIICFRSNFPDSLGKRLFNSFLHTDLQPSTRRNNYKNDLVQPFLFRLFFTKKNSNHLNHFSFLLRIFFAGLISNALFFLRFCSLVLFRRLQNFRSITSLVLFRRRFIYHCFL